MAIHKRGVKDPWHPCEHSIDLIAKELEEVVARWNRRPKHEPRYDPTIEESDDEEDTNKNDAKNWLDRWTGPPAPWVIESVYRRHDAE